LTRFFGFLTLALAVRTFGATGPATLQNDDSCDISITPAATLLLPYFEVDLDSPSAGPGTIFSVTNVTNAAQIARVTLCTDLAYPVVSFNIYLTGYDVQAISLYDIIARGAIGPRLGTGAWTSPVGEHSGGNRELDLSECGVIPPQLDAATVTRMKRAFTLGSIGGACTAIGTVHQHAVGYATIDVVGNCRTSGPTDPGYFTEDIRFDNVLIGDSQLFDGGQNFAQGNPMVHIRAIPAGGTPRTRVARALYAKRFDRTFYGRFQDPAHRSADARQPLPSTFAARWVNGGTGSCETSLKIWREGNTGANADCSDYLKKGLIVVRESVAFDEHENGEGVDDPYYCEDFMCIGARYIRLPSVALLTVGRSWNTFPQSLLRESAAGWLYLNLDDENGENGAHQNWVVVSSTAEGRYSVDFDAAWLGNGCSPPMPVTGFSDNGPPINNPGAQNPNAILPGPAPDVNPPRP
jgi:hypothetical protein